MKSRQKIILDRIIARPLAFLLNFIVWSLGIIIHRDHDDCPAKVKIIVVAKFLGMGSILRSTPLIRVLKEKYPQAKYIFVTTKKNEALVERISLIDKCYFLRDDSIFHIFVDTVFLIIKFWKLKIDLYFDLEVYSAFSTIIATLSFARNRYGFYRESTQFREGLNTHLVYFNDHKHISEIYLQFAKACGIDKIDYKIEKIRLKEEDNLELKNLFTSLRLSEEVLYIVINPNASDLLFERKWPMDYFVLLIDTLVIGWNKPIFLVGSKEEYSYVDTLWNKLSNKAKEIVFNLAGKISLGAVMALISKTKLMITNDSGLYHVAISFDIPTISLWGPGNPEHYADMGKFNNFIFYCKNIYCSPCIYKVYFPPCRGNNICMQLISPKDVYKKACEILRIIPYSNLSFMDDLFKKYTYKKLDITVKRPKFNHRKILF